MLIIKIIVLMAVMVTKVRKNNNHKTPCVYVVSLRGYALTVLLSHANAAKKNF